ncbi:MAG: histidine phosphatase family protein [Gammaproteobacteria bacterium]|nr:histidine phosphatase family protein [Gammaproteobacteria bacterium]
MRPGYKTLAFRLLMTAALTAIPASTLAAPPQELIAALAEGGKAVMMRHTQTQEAEPEVSMHLSGDCEEEQNLDATGRAQAEAIAAGFAAHGIAVAEVYSSEFCRARDTARLAFGEFEAWDALNLVEIQDPTDLAFVMADVEERMGEFEGEGNLVLISHRSTINTVTFQQTEPGDMVVLQPDGAGSAEVLGILPVAALTGAETAP